MTLGDVNQVRLHGLTCNPVGNAKLCKQEHKREFAKIKIAGSSPSPNICQRRIHGFGLANIHGAIILKSLEANFIATVCAAAPLPCRRAILFTMQIAVNSAVEYISHPGRPASIVSAERVQRRASSVDGTHLDVFRSQSRLEVSCTARTIQKLVSLSPSGLATIRRTRQSEIRRFFSPSIESDSQQSVVPRSAWLENFSVTTSQQATWYKHRANTSLPCNSSLHATAAKLSHLPAVLRPMELPRNERARGKREIPEKTRRPTASSGTIPTCEDPGAIRPGIELGSIWWETIRLTAQVFAESLIEAHYRRQDCTPVQCFARSGDERVDAHASVAPSALVLLGLRRAKCLRPGGHLKAVSRLILCAQPIPDWLREAVGTSIVSDFLSHATKGFPIELASTGFRRRVRLEFGDEHGCFTSVFLSAAWRWLQPGDSGGAIPLITGAARGGLFALVISDGVCTPPRALARGLIGRVVGEGGERKGGWYWSRELSTGQQADCSACRCWCESSSK
ncbi:hypothetical protein PR048_027644 [Dryococelus australis]|uniref:Uncharacterized protein n=1 Tax=Dryococelus australis TaxID=614101 RepID=A0ABQ9GH32_9NEOP|nr:hypothetical protein PR048_027644 [Dryococelus australis]